MTRKLILYSLIWLSILIIIILFIILFNWYVIPEKEKVVYTKK